MFLDGFKNETLWSQSFVSRVQQLSQSTEIIETISESALGKLTPRPIHQILQLIKNLSSLNFPKPIPFMYALVATLLEQYIYSSAPMCQAMQNALDIFKEAKATKKILFILSSGHSTDGDPRGIAQELKKHDVTIVTCYLTHETIKDPKCLYNSPQETMLDPSEGRRVLFDISSSIMNTNPAVSYLVDLHWRLPQSGESRLFFQACNLDGMNEVDFKSNSARYAMLFNALGDILEKLYLATKITRINAGFKAKNQHGKTCYANAIAAVFYLAMHRIVGREGGYPTFHDIKIDLIKKYGSEGANAKSVIHNESPKYRLRYKEVDEDGARQAVLHRRPVVTTFYLRANQWDKFSTFFKETRTGILKREDIGGE